MTCWKMIILAAMIGTSVYAQPVKQMTLSGTIRDNYTGEYLSGASVWIPSLKRGTSSNQYGYYALSMPPGKLIIEISFVGYQKAIREIENKGDSIMDFSLLPGLEMEAISVSAHRKENIVVNAVMPGLYYLSAKKIELSPSLLGESDALKTIQFLPGVKAGNEGTSSINVRGGSQDQNLFLLDGVPVYNTNHLFGYFSTFNTDAIKDIRFYKGGIPARYGGRLSSVVDVTMKEGNMKRTGGQFDITPVSGKLMLEGPLKKDKSSWMVSGRRSWIDIPLRAKQIISKETEKWGYSFYDVNAKINWIINSKNRLFLSHYQGSDGYFVNSKDTLVTDKYSFNWGNFTSVARWNLVISPRLFVNTSSYFSKYQFREVYEIIKTSKSGQRTQSGLEEFCVKSDFDLSRTNHTIKFGYQISRLAFHPEITNFTGLEADTVFGRYSVSRANQFSLYGEDEFRPVDPIQINYGLRLLLYKVKGKTSLYPEPRISIKYSTSTDLDLKVSLQKMVQPIHLLTNNSLNMPTDLWVTSTKKTTPAEAWLIDLGLNAGLGNGWNLELDTYYKPMRNLVEYKPGVMLVTGSGKTWEDLTVAGKGLNYGSEIMIEKTSGKITGWAGYTLSWAKRRFEEINEGKYFPFKFDRRHSLSLLVNFMLEETIAKHKDVTLSFIFASGNAITIPDEHIQGTLLPGLDTDFPYLDHFTWYESFPNPNNYRMPPFHHLDLAWSASKKLKKDRERTWKISVYNVYNRLNPYFYYKRYDHFVQVSMLPIIPSVSWSLKF